MSEQIGTVVDPDVPPSPPAQAETPPEPPIQAQPDEEPDAVEVRPGEHMVPVGVVKDLRQQLKQVKPLAEKAAQLEQQVNQYKPYIDFLAQNQHLLQQRPPEPTPAPVQPQDDPELVDLARTLELYDAQTGKPDTTRAAKIRDFNLKTAQQMAQQAIAPVQQATDEQRAASNMQRIMSATVGGKPIEQRFVTDAVRTIAAAVPKTEFMRIMADPTVASVIQQMAIGQQAMAQAGQPAPVPAPQPPPLHIESAGGGTGDLQLTDLSRRVARERGLTDKQYADVAKKYVPGRSIPLE